MKSTFICQHCEEEKARNPRIKKGQRYCNAPDCQQARCRNWKRKKYGTDPTYRQQCLDSNRRWRDDRPAHEYQRNYRASHPDYTEKNRRMQHKRNKNRQAALRIVDLGQKIVNGNSLSRKPAWAGLYVYMPVKFQKIVNGNSLIISMRVNTSESCPNGFKWL